MGGVHDDQDVEHERLGLCNLARGRLGFQENPIMASTVGCGLLLDNRKLKDARLEKRRSC